MDGQDYYGELYGGGGINSDSGRIPATLQSIDEKRYLYKVYDILGNFLGVWNDVISDLAFNQQINSYSTNVDVELARNSDSVAQTLPDIATESGTDIETEDASDITVPVSTANQIGPGTNVDENLKVHIYVFYGSEDLLETESLAVIDTEDGQDLSVDVGAPNGRIMFRGYISQYVSRYGSSETTQVSLVSDGDELNNYMIEDGDGNTTIDYDSQDPSDILKDIIDKMTAEGSIVTYGADTIDDTGTTVTYDFNTVKSIDGVKKVTELSPTDWFGYMDMGTDEVFLKQRPSVVDHTFILGKHIGDFSLHKSIENMVNIVYFVGGQVDGVNLFKKYVNGTSVATYGRKLEVLSDNRVTDEDSADLLANNELSRNGSPQYQTSLDIIDKVYDIESIQLGQLVGFRNFGNYIDDLQLQIVGITYTPDKVTLQLDTLLPKVNKRVEDLKRNLDAVNAVANPVAPS